MKKILFATTALIATASVAAAEVSFSGYGRFGALNRDAGLAPALDATGVYSRIRLQIDMTTEADNGIEFGARLRYQATSFNGGGTINAFNAARFHAKAGGFEVGVGNIQGAIEWMPGLYMGTQSAGIGLSGHTFANLVTNTNGAGYWGWDAYSSGGAGAAAANGVEIKYSAGDFGGHLSYSNNPVSGVTRTGAHISYSFNDWTVALGYQDSNAAACGFIPVYGGAAAFSGPNCEDKVVVTVGGKIGPANVGLAYADNNGTGKFALTANVDVGAATRVDVFVASEDGVFGGESYGLGVSHSLGGGASLEAGISKDGTILDITTMDLGIRFNF
ncbi:porin [Alisedimentitalea sp. MJ-SS2]|uniref:porin n=1 Tax=Aliisedimentitalea sp. MJ-SS2 TaxID=3049795 RepID=UPI002914B144|nr:porin [Alisedimentitalea sp. MJ-SS2]MDU8929274.1 porin [Alisedimentitalea sp. MJ-SS2]